MKWDKKTKLYCLSCLGRSNVVGVGLGFKEVRGKRMKDGALIFLVKKKLPEAKLSLRDIVPKKIGDQKTDVIEVGEIKFLNRLKKMRPAQPGISIGHYKSTAGTLGAVVRSKKDGALFILSNNHVLANATDGSDGLADENDRILQPGPYDGGTDSDIIGHLYEFVPLHKEFKLPSCPIATGFKMVSNTFCKALKNTYRIELFKETKEENLVDAALAKPISGDLVNPEIYELGVPRGKAEVEPGMIVQKSGRTTGITTGIVKVLEATVRVSIDSMNTILLSEQIITSSIGAPGDSGSLVLDTDLNAVGLLCAGSDVVTISNKIDNVLSILDIELVKAN